MTLRPAVTAQVIGDFGEQGDAASALPLSPELRRGEGATDGKARSHDTSRIAWTKPLARVAEEFPLECPNCGGDIRLIAFITDPGRPLDRRLPKGRWPTDASLPKACVVLDGARRG